MLSGTKFVQINSRVFDFYRISQLKIKQQDINVPVHEEGELGKGDQP